MKYLLALFVIIPTVASADVFVVTAPDKSVYSLSESDDAVVPNGYTKQVITNKSIEMLALGDDTTIYNFNGKKFILDDAKVAKKNSQMQSAAIERENTKKVKESAIGKLKALGLSDEEITALIGGR